MYIASLIIANEWVGSVAGLGLQAKTCYATANSNFDHQVRGSKEITAFSRYLHN